MIKWFILAIFILLNLLIFSIKINVNRNKKIKQLEAEIKKGGRIAEQKEKIHAGNDTDNFNNSVDILQKYSEKRH